MFKTMIAPLAALLFGFFCAPAYSDVTIFVAPDGDDRFSGSVNEVDAERGDGPLATPAEALRRVEALRRARPNRDEPIVVELADGVYELAETLAITPSAGGTEKSPTIFRAAPRAKPLLSGGRTISGFAVGSDGRWRVTLDEVRRADWYFQQLFVDGHRRYRPRFPKKSDLTVAERIPFPPEPNVWHGDDAFRVFEGDLPTGWKNLGDVEALCYHNWTVSRRRIASIESNVVTMRGTIECVPPTVTFVSGEGANRREEIVNASETTPWGVYIAGHRYFIENAFETLSEPGEFYLDRATGELTYLPREGERPESVRVTAPRLETLLTIAGTKERRVEYVRFEGLSFAHSNWSTPDAGNVSPQAEVAVEGAILCAGAERVTFERCCFRNLGHWALSFGTACRRCAVTRCEGYDIGAGAVRIGGNLLGVSNWPYEKPVSPSLFELPLEERVTSEIAVTDSQFRYLGRLHAGAVGVWIGHAAGNRVEHCEIADLFYSGVSVGWIWGYGESAARGNRVAFNRIERLGFGLLSDMGGVYTLGVSPGTEVVNNVICDVKSFDYGGWGLYTDCGSTGIVMKKNLVSETTTGSFHQSMGRDNRIENNILVNSLKRQIQRTSGEPHNSFFFERNIVYWENDSPLLGYAWDDGRFEMDYNLYWNPNVEPILFDGLTFAQWKKERRKDEHSLIADPLFQNPKAGDFRLRSGSPAEKIGFEPIDFSDVGPRFEPIYDEECGAIAQEPVRGAFFY